MTNNELRKQYTRLRDIIRKRYKRAKEQGLADLPIYDIVKVFKPLRELTDKQLPGIIQQADLFVRQITLSTTRDYVQQAGQRYRRLGLPVTDIISFNRFEKEANERVQENMEYLYAIAGQSLGPQGIAKQNTLAAEVMEEYRRWLLQGGRRK